MIHLEQLLKFCLDASREGFSNISRKTSWSSSKSSNLRIAPRRKFIVLRIKISSIFIKIEFDSNFHVVCLSQRAIFRSFRWKTGWLPVLKSVSQLIHETDHFLSENFEIHILLGSNCQFRTRFQRKSISDRKSTQIGPHLRSSELLRSSIKLNFER